MSKTRSAPAPAVEPPSANSPDLMKAAEVMDRLRIGRRTLERMIAENRLPPYTRVGRTYRWTVDTVEAYIEANRVGV